MRHNVELLVTEKNFDLYSYGQVTLVLSLQVSN